MEPGDGAQARPLPSLGVSDHSRVQLRTGGVWPPATEEDKGPGLSSVWRTGVLVTDPGYLPVLGPRLLLGSRDGIQGLLSVAAPILRGMRWDCAGRQ